MRWLSRGRTSNAPRVLVCTGERMAPLINRLYRPLGVQTTTYEPVHQGLKNEFCCYANFECEAWRWKKKEDVATGREQ
jgi:hypothetical protein